MPAASPRRPEILAPAGTEEAFAAALASGADAVFFGLSEGFNARARSTAFRLEGLPELPEKRWRQREIVIWAGVVVSRKGRVSAHDPI